MRAFIDLNCPFCYALSEWIDEAEIGNQVDWRLIDHNPEASFRAFSDSEIAGLTEEIFNIRQREETLQIQLPFGRPNVRAAERLLIEVKQKHPEKFLALKSRLYKAYWMEDQNIEDESVLQGILTDLDLFNITANPKNDVYIENWTREWNDGPYDRRIPVLQKSRDDICLGLPPKQNLMDYLLGGDSSHQEHNESCQYEARTNIAIHGNWKSLWTLLKQIRLRNDVLFYTDVPSIAAIATGANSPDIVILQYDMIEEEKLAELADIAKLLDNHDIPLLLIIDNLPEEQELFLIKNRCSDVFVNRSVPYVLAKLLRHIRVRKTISTLSKRSMTDSLTGLANRRSGLSSLEIEWARASRTKLPISVLLIDIDYFKLYNDHYGHLAGDGCLRKIAQIFAQKTGRKNDLVCRYGGEEFLFVLPETDRLGAVIVAEYISDTIEKHNIEHAAAPLGRVSVSIGISTHLYDKNLNLNEIIQLTDEQLYKAKADGRNLFRIAG